ncbi:segregation/condensation protein A [Halalkalibacterium halodurans]|uniref:Segregation and condensation protein A n=1 Tax=Halalkalibacterium halodurans TaxID=86665 RepID=A0A0M0KKW1_ALKHA|nr:segregation/condensation protein A [Halalkalibacterium halodurans]MED3646802.1 segregation/condensation protein A [Halalkalibacterium halodurans]TES56316.1 segregation/condensation protein A [Halalkalibacterium halodurans]TPE70488.1 segregation/condensation protein A [Halalkalibacterium halodurans]
MNPYSVKLDTFEGPLDLLLHLINQAEVDIYDIPVALITEQYMAYIHTMQELQLDVASEYLVMAATLLQIKSKMLLPKQEEIFDETFEYEEEDPREELMFRLIEYRRYKEAAQELKEKEGERSQVHTRLPDNLDDYLTEEERQRQSIQGVTLFDMLAAYQKLLKRRAYSRPRTSTVKVEEYSIDERMTDILIDLEKCNGKCRFQDLFVEKGRGHMVVTFLAMLELMKTDAIYCEQNENFADIWIYRREGKNRDIERASSSH